MIQINNINLKMLLLPQDIILTIAQYIKRDYVGDEDEDDLLKENGEGYYYPIRNLYATCKSLNWLSRLEYICIEACECYYHVASRNIHGQYHGMLYQLGANHIMGYSQYNLNTMVYENSFHTDCSYHYRHVNNIIYMEDENCLRWYNQCNNQCKTCIQLNNIESQIATKDPMISQICKQYYDDGTIFIREFKNVNLILDYCTEGLILKEDYFRR